MKLTEVVERAESTTYWFSEPFHLIKSVNEVANILIDTKNEEIFIRCKYVDRDSFLPIVVFSIIKNDRIVENYVGPLHLLLEKEQFKVKLNVETL